MPTSRQCGPCTSCCTALEIVELNKPAGVPCTNLGPSGCSIYATRPEPCRAFMCGWLEGFGSEDERPDQTKIILRTGHASDGPLKDVPFAMAHETEPGASEKRVGRKVLNALAKKITVVLIRLDGRRSFWK